jgi:hypothetical protein
MILTKSLDREIRFNCRSFSPFGIEDLINYVGQIEDFIDSDD